MFDLSNINWEEVPILLTPIEYDSIFDKGKKICMHRWVYRKELPAGMIRIVYPSHISDTNMPRGRICRKCGKIELEAGKEGDYTDAKHWQQIDFTPDG